MNVSLRRLPENRAVQTAQSKAVGLVKPQALLTEERSAQSDPAQCDKRNRKPVEAIFQGRFFESIGNQNSILRQD